MIGDPGLTNPADALITLIVRYQGRAIPGVIPQQLTNFEGGCPEGESPCVDEQLVIFLGDCDNACLDPNNL